MNQVLVVKLGSSNRRFVCVSCDNLAGDQAVLPKPVDSLEVPALEIQVGIVYEFAVDFRRRKRTKTLQDALIAIGVPG